MSTPMTPPGKFCLGRKPVPEKARGAADFRLLEHCPTMKTGGGNTFRRLFFLFSVPAPQCLPLKETILDPLRGFHSG